ncbi:hypothetical protein [Peribacillus frigoritolerans]|uniref:hypothetical protein n=1 Tax=Peribacillus castrilensis TaxID=2897690 RepID=UPI00296E2F48|nr:hypothetical protein [Peribacillus castrilensis]
MGKIAAGTSIKERYAFRTVIHAGKNIFLPACILLADTKVAQRKVNTTPRLEALMQYILQTKTSL